jgi:hypothetical protein
VAVVAAVTAPVVIVNVAPIAPSGTFTLAGTEAAALSLDSVTFAPPAGAWPLRVTVPVEDAPPVTLGGFIETVATPAGFTVSDPVAVPLSVPEIVTGVDELTGIVVTVKVADDDPAATVTLFGIIAAALLLDSGTTTPPAGAGPLKVTVPVEVVPPITVEGFNVTEAIASGSTVKVVVWVPWKVPEIVMEVVAATEWVVTAKFAVVAPAAMVTLYGITEGSLLDNATVTPPVGAGPLSVTDPVEDAPPITLEGFTLMEETATNELAGT